MRILIADNKKNFSRSLSSYLAERGHQTEQVFDAALLEAALPASDVLIVDTSFLREPLPLFLNRVLDQHPQLQVVGMSDTGGINESLAALKNGALDYLLKPFALHRLDSLFEKIGSEELTNDEVAVEQGFKKYTPLDALPSVSRHAGMKKAVGLLKNVASSDITVLISGESGVGKEVFATTLHQLSKRASHRHVAINCASIPAPLLEVELFGCERGAYTGANARRVGKFEVAQKGTILLDEISEMDMGLQSKLLRVIQEKEVFRVGGNERIPLDVRIVATSNRDMRSWVSEGRFREDLFYRLNVISIHIPPLRERLEDVPVLAEQIIKNFNEANPGKRLALSMEALEQLCQYTWPGNVRELENILTRTAYLTHGQVIDRIYFDERLLADHKSQAAVPVMGTLEEVERRMIYQALDLHDGNRVRAANILGISVRTLRNKLKLYRAEEKAKGNSMPSLDSRGPAPLTKLA